MGRVASRAGAAAASPHQIPLPAVKAAVGRLIEAKMLFFSLLQRLIGFFSRLLEAPQWRTEHTE